MNYKAAIASAALALCSLAANAATTSPTLVSGSFTDVLLGNITVGTPSNVDGNGVYATSFKILGMDYPLPVGTFSSISLFLGTTEAGRTSGNTFTFSNLAAGTYSLKASGSVSGYNWISAQYEVTPVPEPETFAMLLAGLGVMGAIARRRKVAAAAV